MLKNNCDYRTGFVSGSNYSTKTSKNFSALVWEQTRRREKALEVCFLCQNGILNKHYDPIGFIEITYSYCS